MGFYAYNNEKILSCTNQRMQIGVSLKMIQQKGRLMRLSPLVMDLTCSQFHVDNVSIYHRNATLLRRWL